MEKKTSSCDYNAELNSLKKSGPERLYFLHGPEKYLRELFLDELKKICLTSDDSDFSYKRFDGDVDPEELENAINLLPFLSEHTLIELRDFDFSHAKDSQFSDIPSYCTVVIICDKEPDSRLKATKNIKSLSKDLYFGEQAKPRLIKWIQKRFESFGKSISDQAADRLIFISGDLMSSLIPEIDKISAYSSNTEITVNDVNMLAHHIPEADAFEMVNRISDRNFDGALRLLGEVIADKNNSPIAVLSALGYSLRRMYGKKLDGIQVGFTKKNLENDIAYCAECEYRFKTSGGDEADYLKDAVMRVIINENQRSNNR